MNFEERQSALELLTKLAASASIPIPLDCVQRDACLAAFHTRHGPSCFTAMRELLALRGRLPFFSVPINAWSDAWVEERKQKLHAYSTQAGELTEAELRRCLATGLARDDYTLKLHILKHAQKDLSLYRAIDKRLTERGAWLMGDRALCVKLWIPGLLKGEIKPDVVGELGEEAVYLGVRAFITAEKIPPTLERHLSDLWPFVSTPTQTSLRRLLSGNNSQG